MKPNALQVAWTKDIGIPEEGPTNEVRRHIRYPLRAPAIFTWIGNDGMRREARGNTRDLSEGGAYVTTRTCPPAGIEMTLLIRFPYLTDLGQFHRIEMTGKVIRIDLPLNSRANYGFAVRSARTILQETDPSEDESQEAN